jgi:uncharacterized protein YbaP (TraB family)|tara:strand:+ start:1548 stop:2432 length:885 start_codon:yes stop_codon:yes gene_type:complete
MKSRILRSCGLMLGCLFSTCVLSSIASADSSVWLVQAEDHTVYLGGTVHLLRAADYPLPDEYGEAYAASASLVFETDLSSMSDLSVQAKLLQQLRYDDGESLKTVLNEEAYSVLEAYTGSIGLPLAMLEQFKPGMIVSTLQIMEFQRIGFTPQGVDAYFNTLAMSDGKPLGQLETIDAQIGFLASMGEGNESEFILLSLKDLEDTVEVMDDMIAAWRIGDNDALSELFVTDMLEQAPEIYDSLLKQRNLNWLPQLEDMLESPEIEFVLVGAAHLVGPDGLLAMLQAKGYQISQL